MDRGLRVSIGFRDFGLRLLLVVGPNIIGGHAESTDIETTS